MDWVWLSGLYFYDQSQPIIKKYFHNPTQPNPPTPKNLSNSANWVKSGWF